MIQKHLKIRGFTLIEIVCCLSIFLIIAAGTVFNISKLRMIYEIRCFKQTGNILLMDLRYAKLEAGINGGTDVIFNKKGYRILQDNKAIKIVEFKKGITYDLKYCIIPNKITFTGYGTILPRPCSVAIKDKYGNLIVISIKVGTYTIDFKEVNDKKRFFNY